MDVCCLTGFVFCSKHVSMETNFRHEETPRKMGRVSDRLLTRRAYGIHLGKR